MSYGEPIPMDFEVCRLAARDVSVRYVAIDIAVATHYAGNMSTFSAVAATAHCLKVGKDVSILLVNATQRLRSVRESKWSLFESS